MYSLNVPVPGRVRRLAADLHPELAGFDRVREEHTLVCKRLGDPTTHELPSLQADVRRALSGAAPFAARVDEVGTFEEPTAGPGPVVYLAVESPGLRAAHDRLVDALGAAAGVEGDEYVPHVTLARGGDPETASALDGRRVGPVEWTVSELVFWDGRSGGPAGRLPLPA